MTSPAIKRFNRDYLPLANAIARLDITQTDREKVADAITAALTGRRDFRPGTFRLLASDPLSACPGTDDGPCPKGIEIRTGMHNSKAPDGRSIMWQEDKPIVRCVECGMPHLFKEEKLHG